MDVLSSANSAHAAIANPDKKMYGLQFHPEVSVHFSSLLKSCGDGTEVITFAGLWVPRLGLQKRKVQVGRGIHRGSSRLDTW